ncbi:hypothetical protein [Sphingomonas arenae]|uniref:hypothetical protein n=1 Tax=Sphingomonas arenae TaxID=2812555 RepID=UPI00196741C5|nr:hypothetical protein [Sphingomonas arenae]
MANPLKILGLVALATMPFEGAAGQTSVQMRLSGTLQPRCNAKVHDLQVTPGEDLKLTLQIAHSCNAAHTLLLRVTKGAGADLTRTSVNYNGKQPSMRTEETVSFRYNLPVTTAGLLTISLPRASKRERDAIVQTFTVMIVPD